jgi:hypothetical protein
MVDEDARARDEVDRHVAIAVARYLDGVSYDAEAAHQAIAVELGGWLGRLILQHLLGETSWSRWWSIDDAHPDQMDPVGPLTVEASGVAYLLPSGEQPFAATLTLDASRTRLASYLIRFGDAAVGLSANAEDERLRRHWPEVRNWLFEFDSSHY